jgi:hypothetical protein
MKASARVGMSRRMRNDFSMYTADIVYVLYSTNISLELLQYNVGDEEKLEKIQRRAARVVMKVDCSDDALMIFDEKL